MKVQVFFYEYENKIMLATLFSLSVESGKNSNFQELDISHFLLLMAVGVLSFQIKM